MHLKLHTSNWQATVATLRGTYMHTPTCTRRIYEHIQALCAFCHTTPRYTHPWRSTQTQNTNTHCPPDAGPHPGSISHTRTQGNTHGQPLTTRDVLHTCEQIGPNMPTHVQKDKHTVKSSEECSGGTRCLRTTRPGASALSHTHTNTCARTCVQKQQIHTQTVPHPLPNPQHTHDVTQPTAHTCLSSDIHGNVSCGWVVLIRGRVVSAQGPRVTATAFVLPGPLVLRWT